MTVAIPVRGIDHVGVTVPDIEEAAHILEAALVATSVDDVQSPSDPPMVGVGVERQLGRPYGTLIVHMRPMRLGSARSLELNRFAHAEHLPSSSLNDFGLQHFAAATT